MTVFWILHWVLFSITMLLLFGGGFYTILQIYRGMYGHPPKKIKKKKL